MSRQHEAPDSNTAEKARYALKPIFHAITHSRSHYTTRADSASKARKCNCLLSTVSVPKRTSAALLPEGLVKAVSEITADAGGADASLHQSLLLRCMDIRACPEVANGGHQHLCSLKDLCIVHERTCRSDLGLLLSGLQGAS